MEYHSMGNSDHALIQRLKRIEGQVRGVTNMIEEGRYCVDVLQQINAIRAALGKVENEVLKSHANTCVEEAIQNGKPEEQRKKFAELIDLFGRVKK